MTYMIVKYLITAALVVLVSEFAKSSDKLGGLIAALPLVTILTLIWLYIEHQSISKIANHAYYTFWFVLPTLPMFLLFANFLPKFGFWLTISSCIAFTVIFFYIYALIIKQFGIHLF